MQVRKPGCRHAVQRLLSRVEQTGRPDCGLRIGMALPDIVKDGAEGIDAGAYVWCTGEGLAAAVDGI